MEKINVATFMKKISPASREYIVSAYASEELNLYGKIIIVSTKVKEVTAVTHNKKIIGYVFPKKETIEEVITENKDIIKSYIGIDAPYVGIYSMTKQLLVKEIRL